MRSSLFSRIDMAIVEATKTAGKFRPRNTKRIARARSTVVVAVLAAVVVAGLCLKARPMPFVWFFGAWAISFFGLIFCVRGSWPRALLFNASLAAATLAGAEAYFALQERENPTCTPEYKVKDDVLGWAPAKGVRTQATKFHHRNLVYDVAYTIDANGLRVSPPVARDLTGTALFFGCSFTFGEGLEDHEALPYQVGIQSDGRWRTFNFAFGGYGPHQMLAALEDGRVRRLVDSRPRYAFYVAIPAQVGRVAKRTVWGNGSPRYRLDRDGIPRLDGHFGDEGNTPSFLESWMLRLVPQAGPELHWQLSKSAIYRMYSSSDSPTTEDDVRLYMAVVGRAREILLADYPGLEFHVIFWPSHFIEYRALYREMFEGFCKLDVPVHRVEDILPGYNVEVPTTNQTRYLLAPTDGHPNALANRLLAEYVVHRILERESGAVDPQRSTASPSADRPRVVARP